MGQSVTNLAGAALRVYDENVHEQVFTKNVLFMNVLKNVAKETGAASVVGSSTTGGGGKMMTVHYGRNIGSAAGGETITLPSAGQQSYLQANIPMKYNFQSISITDVVLEASKKSKEFLVDALDSEYKGAKEDMQRQLSRQGYGIGTGVIAQVNGIGSSPTFDLDNPMIGKNPTDYFDAGDAGVGTNVMFSASATSESSTAFSRVTAITDGDTFTVASGSGVADNDYIFLAHYISGSTSTVSNLNSEIMGIKGLIDDSTNLTTLQGLSRSTYTWWQSYVNDATSQRSLTDALMQDTYLEAEKKGKVNLILTSFDLYSAYGQLLTPDRRYTEKMTVNGGFTGVSFNTIPFIKDYDHPYDEMNFLDTSSLSVEDIVPMSFIDSDGSILSRSTTQPLYTATLRWYSNLANSAPNKSSVLRDVIK